MTLVDLALGSLEVESKIHGLQLQCSSSARVAPSAEDDLDRLRRRLTQWSLNAHSDDHVWFERGPDYHLRILLRFDDVPGVDEDAVVEEVSSLLKEAKVANIELFVS